MNNTPYNIFKVLKFDRKETIHSAMIAAIASHDAKSRIAFFNMLKKKAFENEINLLLDSIDFDSNKDGQWINTEVVLDKTDKEDTWGRADIWVGTNKKDTKKYRLIIENKIDAEFQYRQIRGYYRYLIDGSRVFAGLFVLCPEYRIAETIEHIKEKYNKESVDEDTKCAIITYEQDIKNWLEEVKKSASGDFLKVVDDYLDIVESL